MRYRINYGNGQVDCVGCSLARCRRELPSCGPFAYIQFQDAQTGDWFRVRSNKAAA